MFFSRRPVHKETLDFDDEARKLWAKLNLDPDSRSNGRWNAVDPIYKHPTGNGIIYVGETHACEHMHREGGRLWHVCVGMIASLVLLVRAMHAEGSTLRCSHLHPMSTLGKTCCTANFRSNICMHGSARCIHADRQHQLSSSPECISLVSTPGLICLEEFSALHSTE